MFQCSSVPVLSIHLRMLLVIMPFHTLVLIDDTQCSSISASLLVSLGVLLAFLVVVLKFRRQIFSVMDRRRRRSSDTATVEQMLQKHGALAPKRYRYSELKTITRSFEHKLGEGGYGAVFRGFLNGDDGHRPVAVKILHNSRSNGAEEFLNEVISIGRTSHVNVVTLLGFCLETSHRALVYEHMPNGSLDKYIYSNKQPAALRWEALHEVAVGVARGLEYLHEGCNTRIIHFDIKPHNVLLDVDLRPKIADFGMAKLCNPKESILSMADARGTIGFIAPEVFSRGFGVVSVKSDVYSYGMLLLEMVGGGRSNARAYAEDSNDIFFPLWVYDHMIEDGVLVMKDGFGGEEVARKMALIGLWCIQTVPASRPSMSRVLEMLERSVHELPMPPRPYHASPSNSPSPSHPSSYPSTTFASDSTQRCVQVLSIVCNSLIFLDVTETEPCRVVQIKTAYAGEHNVMNGSETRMDDT
jgi:serine/threonine protein kinase